MFLTNQEIIELTGRRYKAAQRVVLCHMGIEHKVRPDGSLAVLKSHIDKQFDGIAESVTISKRIEPNWGALA